MEVQTRNLLWNWQWCHSSSPVCIILSQFMLLVTHRYFHFHFALVVLVSHSFWGLLCMETKSLACSSLGFILLYCSNCSPEHLIEEIRNLLPQVSSSSWYSPMHTPSTYSESQPVASNSRLHRMDMLAATTCGAQTGTLNMPCTSSLTELSNQLGISTSAIQGQNQRAYRDAFNEQDQQSQFDLQNQLAFGAGGGLGPMAAPKRCPSPAPSSSTLPRLAKCPPQSEAQGRQPLSGSSSYHPSVGTAEFAMNPSSTLIRAGLEDKRHVIPCPPKPMRTYTKVLFSLSSKSLPNIPAFIEYNISYLKSEVKGWVRSLLHPILTQFWLSTEEDVMRATIWQRYNVVRHWWVHQMKSTRQCLFTGSKGHSITMENCWDLCLS